VESRTLRRLVVAIAGVALLAAAGPAQQTGTFALLGGTPKIVSKLWAEHGTGETYTLHVRQFAPNGGAAIVNYDIDMQHYMHMVIVRDDFATFAHKHPAYAPATGTFEQTFTKERNHRYYVFADTTPHGVGQQVFRFTLDSDGPYAAYKLSTAASSYNSKAGPYNVLLQKTTVAANTPQTLDLTVVKGDDPATDLVPYLGAPAHVVMIDMSTLSYIHVHPMLKGQKSMPHGGMDMSDMDMAGSGRAGPFMRVMLPALPTGVYKTWIQISGGKDLTVYTAPFTIVAR
jgi:hypothetical protein